MTVRLPRARWILRLAAVLCVAAGPAGAQGVPSGATDSILSATRASPLLPPSHWAHSAMRRAEAAGWIAAYRSGHTGVPRHVAAAALRAAIAGAAAAGDGVETPTGWLDRFEEEFPDVLEAPPAGREIRLLSGAASVEVGRRDGWSAPGTGEFSPERTGALPLPDRTTGGLALEASVAIGAGIAGSIQPMVGDDFSVPAWEVAAAWKGVQAGVGRGETGYGAGRGGGVVFSPTVALDRVQVGTTRPVILPGILGAIGAVGIHTFVGRLPDDRHPGGPILWGMSAGVQPHDRLFLAVNRGALVGGEHTDHPVTLWRLVLAGVGKHAGIENQVVSGEFRYRVPVESLLPLSVYCEAGAEDSAGAVVSVPGFVCGAYVPVVPGAPRLGIGVERAEFGGSCCGNPPWYRHWMFPGSWSDDTRPLGHPLGGEGREWLGYADWTGWDARLRVHATAFARRRGAENLYVPGRDGESRGAGSRLFLRISPRGEVVAEAAWEDGAGWTERTLRLGAHLAF